MTSESDCIDLEIIEKAVTDCANGFFKNVVASLEGNVVVIKGTTHDPYSRQLATSAAMRQIQQPGFTIRNEICINTPRK